MTTAAWHQKKSWALVATRDHNINLDLERSMAKRAGGETIEVPASHAVYVSKPEDVRSSNDVVEELPAPTSRS